MDKRARLAALLAQPRLVGPTTWGQGAQVLQQFTHPTSAAGNMRSTLRLLHAADPDDWRARLQAVVDRHPILRTTYDLVATGLSQRVQPTHRVAFDSVDARDWTAAELTSRLSADAHRPMDVYRGPVFRACLYQRTHESILQTEVHHAAADLWSLELILAELHTRPTGPPPPPFLAYVAWHMAWLRSPAGRAAAAWWDHALEGASGLRIGHSEDLDPAACLRFHIDAQAVRERCRTRGITLFTLLLSVFQVVLTRLTGQTDICIASPAANRAAPFLETVGIFVNALMYRQQLAGLTPDALLGRNRDLIRTALEHQAHPVWFLADGSRSLTDALLLFQQYQKAHWAAETTPNDLGLRSGGFAQTPDGLEEILYVEHATINTPLVLDILEQQTTLNGLLRYRTTALTAAQAAFLIQDFKDTLQDFIR